MSADQPRHRHLATKAARARAHALGGMSMHLQDHEIMDIYATLVVLTGAGEIV
jgi:hypothetical protein